MSHAAEERFRRVCLILLAGFTLAFVAGCSRPVMFRVQVDEAVLGGKLTLNGNSARLIKNVDGAYWAKWDGNYASGEILVEYPDGATVKCQIDHVTHDMTEIQDFRILQRRCGRSM